MTRKHCRHGGGMRQGYPRSREENTGLGRATAGQAMRLLEHGCLYMTSPSDCLEQLWSP